ncbi:MAG: VWA domain-containing protein [Oscillospiraceae bacterium]|nr:VWA domain-containing protein [Oscillospiraceae bacterium]
MKKLISLALVFVLLMSLAGCMNVYDDPADDVKEISRDDAIEEMEAILSKVHVYQEDAPVDLDMVDYSNEADALADISVFPITVQGNGEINIEIAADTELSSDAPDDWMNVLAKKFNQENHEYNGKKVSVTVRQITGGEVVTYMRAGLYQPDLYVPSHGAWGKMLEASGIPTITLCDRLLGNTAGILISDKVYDGFIEKYKEATMKTVVEATINGDLTFAYTYPYASSTGLNMLTMILTAFDPENPLSETASSKLMEYQKTAPPTAHTTAIMRNNAKRGIVNAMAMEEQAYVLNDELKNYVYIPVGIRHDHPVFTFSYVSQEKQEAAQLFIDYCLTDDAQKLGTEKGFNRHEDYKGQDPGLDGMGYLAAQKLWKQNKTGGRPVIAVFVTDVSGSMRGNKLASLQDALVRSAQFISADNYLGLVAFSTDVYEMLPIGQFDATQRAKFSGAVKQLRADGGTAIYDATMVATKMLLEKQQELPDAIPVMFILSDGQQQGGVNLNRVLPIVKALKIPIYTIGFEMLDDDMEEMRKLSQVSGEADLTDAGEKDVVNVLRGLLNSRT